MSDEIDALYDELWEKVAEVNLAMMEGRWDPDGMSMCEEIDRLNTLVVQKQKAEQKDKYQLGPNDIAVFGEDGEFMHAVTVIPAPEFDLQPIQYKAPEPVKCGVCGEYLPFTYVPYSGQLAALGFILLRKKDIGTTLRWPHENKSQTPLAHAGCLAL